MEFIAWLQDLARDADSAPGFQAQPSYIVVSVMLPVVVGLCVGFGLRFLERVLGVELGKGSAH